MSDMICRKSLTRCLTPGMCSPHGGCSDGVTQSAEAPSPAEYSFHLEGIGFRGMPLERVAQYITALSDLVGSAAKFSRMTDDAIYFTEAKS